MTIETRWPEFSEGYDGKGKTWSKRVESVELKAKSGYDWHGQFVREGQLAEVEPGTLVVVANIARRNRGATVALFRLTPDGEWDRLAVSYSREWAYELRGKALEALSSTPDLDALRAEKQQLLSRIAEIDAVLQGEGTCVS